MRKLDVLQPAAIAEPGHPAAGGCGSPPATWPQQKPRWLKVKAPGGSEYRRLKGLMKEMGLNSVCEEAHCPNIGECWDAGTATFLIMGDKCTRNCPYCAIAHGRPEELDEDEPRRVAEMIEQLALRHVVITSVDRDVLPDGGARIFGWLIDDIHERLPECSIEVLTPDFRGMRDSISRVIAARPDIFNHNMETVERLHPEARPGARYERSLEVLRYAKSQYLRPSQRHRAIDRYVTPEEFADWKSYGEGLGFLHVESGPLVRSSYHAREQVEELKRKANAA
jgi:lipoic acid synthetase